MKLNRTSWLGFLLGLALLLVAVAIWHIAALAPVRKDADAAVAVSQAPAGQLATREANHQLAGLPSVEREIPSMRIKPEQQTAPFLKELAAALELIQAELDTAEKETKLQSLANEMAAADLPAALEFLKERESLEAGPALGLRLIRCWAENDPRAAAEWVEQNFADLGRQEAVNAVAIAWANRELAAAVAWVRQLPEEERVGGLITVAYEAARTEPMEALGLVIELPESQARDELVVHASTQWAASAPEVAAEWAAEITDPALRERVLSVIVAAWGESSPQAAAMFAVRSLAPGRRLDDAVSAIVQRWAQKEPEQTAAWVMMFSEGKLRDASVENLVKLWADQDLVQAQNWLAGLDLGASRDMAIGAYAGKITPLAPEVAMLWAEEISDDALRDQHMEAIGEAWMESDEAAARAWIAQSPFHETTKAWLLTLKSR